MLEWFYIVLGIMVAAIVGFIVKAVRMTNAEIHKKMGPLPDEWKMKKAIEEIRKRDISCPRCGKQTFAMLGTQNRYKCDTCNHEFEGPDHI
jgi:DNA-directed RNA polymerase subunit RPC12/RpoP